MDKPQQTKPEQPTDAKKVYTDAQIREFNISQTDTHIKNCVALRELLGYRKIDDLACRNVASRNYENSLRRRAEGKMQRGALPRREKPE